MHYSATTFAKPFQYNWLSGWSSVVYSKFIRIKNDTISLDPDVEQGEQPAAVKIKVGGRVFEEREITYFAMENLTPVKKTKINKTSLGKGGANGIISVVDKDEDENI